MGRSMTSTVNSANVCLSYRKKLTLYTTLDGNISRKECSIFYQLFLLWNLLFAWFFLCLDIDIFVYSYHDCVPRCDCFCYYCGISVSLSLIFLSECMCVCSKVFVSWNYLLPNSLTFSPSVIYCNHKMCTR